MDTRRLLCHLYGAFSARVSICYINIHHRLVWGSALEYNSTNVDDSSNDNRNSIHSSVRRVSCFLCA